ncbi:PAS domain S-box protein [Halocatena marina]|nr:PAS domain S-box protein [Halocatena marina]
MSSRHASEDVYAETLSVFEHTDHPNEPLTSPEIADSLDCPRRTAYKRLQKLVDLGALRTKKVSSSGRVWWRLSTTSTDDLDASKSDRSELEAGQATKSRYQRFVEQSLVGVCIIQDGIVKYVNPTFTDILGYTPDEALGESVLDFVAEDERARVAEYVRQREHGEIDVIRYEGRGKHADGTAVDVEIHGDLIEYEGEPAILGTLVDMSERKERERELEDYRIAVENVRDGVYMTDADRRFTMVNDAYCELTGYTREELLGSSFSQVVDNEGLSQSAELIQDLREGERDVASTDSYHYTPDGERIPVENRFTIRPDDEAFQGTTGVVRDSTDRLERERELREQRDRYHRLVETSSASIVIYTADGTIAYVNDAATDRLAANAADDLLGESAIEFVHPDDRFETTERIQRVIDERVAHSPIETKLIDANGRLKHAILTSTPIMHEGEPAAQIVVNDITDRKERERQLELYETIFETINDGVYAVDGEGYFTMVNEAYANMVGYDREELCGEHVSLIVDETIIATAEEVEAEMRRGEGDEPKVEADLQRSDGETTTAEATFSLLPGEALHERVGVVRDITERKEQERRLEQQRQEVAALNHLQGVALNVSDIVLGQSTRTEMEQRVCERLAASNVYDFAWIGHTSRDGRELTAHAATGASGHLTDITISLDENDPTGQGPIAQAMNTQSVQLSRNICEDPAYEQWCEDRDCQTHSVIAVPIVYKGRRYGVLNLYTERSATIGDIEQAIIRQLAEIVGHAITALERGKSLLADRMIEVEYYSTVLAEPLVSKVDGALELSSDRAIHLDDDDYLHYYTIDGLTAEQCMELVDEFPSVTSARVLIEEGDHVRIAVRMTDDTLAALFWRFDGRTKSTEITNDELRVVGELPATANVRAVTEAVEEIHPDMEFAGQRYITRQQVSPGEFRTVIEDSLTDRQRTALEAACYSGFFDSPRESSGEDVAASLDISSSTFHQHLRKAQKKLLNVAFGNALQ